MGKFLNGVGALSQVLGMIGGALVVVGGIMAANQLRIEPATARWLRENVGFSVEAVQAAIAALGVMLGAAAFGTLWIAGMLVSAAGQILKAVLDTAVYASPFYSDSDRLKIIR